LSGGSRRQYGSAAVTKRQENFSCGRVAIAADLGPQAGAARTMHVVIAKEHDA
jgi:hypothetical protein